MTKKQRFALARRVTIERLSEVFGHETAHLDPWEQHYIACEAILMLKDACQGCAEEMRAILGKDVAP